MDKKITGNYDEYIQNSIYDLIGDMEIAAFKSENEIHEYFSKFNIENMFGECVYTHEQLTEIINYIINYLWSNENE